MRLSPSTFRGVTSITPDLPGCSLDRANNAVTLCNGTNVLLDGVLGPQRPNLNNDEDKKKFIAWNSSGGPYISFEMQDPSIQITAIDLYILNYPGQNISMPNMQLYRTSNPTTTDPNIPFTEFIDFYLLDNDELSKNDTTRKKVILRPRTPFSSGSILLRWTFRGLYKVHWFLLSEIRFCKDSQSDFIPGVVLFRTPPLKIKTLHPSAEDLARGSLALICTVPLQGSFNWRWRKGQVTLRDSNKFSILGADGTRTSRLIIHQLDYMDAENYSCDATYSILVSYRTRKYDVQFPSKF